MSAHPTVFISYSWESDEHRRWVGDLARELEAAGAIVRLDQWYLAPANYLPAFMETGIRESDFVLVICTPDYKNASDSGSGGVGYEGQIIGGELFVKRNDSKFIPILRHGEWPEAAPSALLGRWYIDMRDGFPGAPFRLLVDTLFGNFVRSSFGPVTLRGGRRPALERTAGSPQQLRQAPPRKLIAHFLDHYILELSGYGRGNRVLDRRIAAEASAAFRYALLAADEVLVPAVSFFQSPLCARIVTSHRSLFSLGSIRLIADSWRWEEFQENRLREYPRSSRQHDIYQSFLRGRRGDLPALVGSSRNTTFALHDRWRDLVVPGGGESIRRDAVALGLAENLRVDFEANVRDLPEILGNRAFISENVSPQLFGRVNGSLAGSISSMICSMFFGIFAQDFESGFVDDLVYIGRSLQVRPEASFTISYSQVRRDVELSGELRRRIYSCRPLELLRLRRDERMAALIDQATTTDP